MGVTILQQYPILENRTPLQTIEFLTKNLLTLGGVQTGQFLVDCETYSVLAQGGKLCRITFFFKWTFSCTKIDCIQMQSFFGPVVMETLKSRRSNKNDARST